VPSLAASTGSTTIGIGAARSSRAIPGDAARDVVRGEHPDLHRVRSQVGEQHAELLEHDVRKDRQHPVHLRRVLHGERRDDAGPVHAEGPEDLEIGLEPGAARGIGSGDRESDAHDRRW
jgi:hypothetical protein